MFHSSHRCIEGRPHADRDDDLNAVVALATGTLPQEAGQIHELLSTAPGQGQSLNSAFAVGMGQPDVAKDGFFYDSSRGYDEDAILRQKNRGVGQPAGTESAMTLDHHLNTIQECQGRQ